MRPSSRLLCCAVVIALCQIAPLAAAQTIEIKGLSVGMPRAEVRQKHPTWKDFTIAEVPSKYKDFPLSVEYFDEKLDYLLFFFNAGSFTTVLDAVKEKYPDIKCENSQVGNAVGATFTQIDCTLQDELSVLRLSRFVSDIRTSSLSLMSKRKQIELEEKSKQKKKDI